MELVIDRGVKSYDVKDVDGTLLGVIKINPADIGISGRFVSARNAIAELAEQAKQDMTPEKILAMDTTIKAELNKVFGSDVSSVFFGGLSALALAEKELLDQIFAASAMTGFAMRRLPEKFDEDEIFERRLLNVAEKNGSVYFFLENGELILDEPEFLEREECDSPAARTILKAF